MGLFDFLEKKNPNGVEIEIRTISDKNDENYMHIDDFIKFLEIYRDHPKISSNNKFVNELISVLLTNKTSKS